MGNRGAVLGAVLAALALAIFPAGAAAKNLFTLDSEATSRGHLIQDAAGNAYVSWTSEGFGTGPEVPKFCKVAPGGTCNPISLSIPGATSLADSVSAAIPVFGPGNTIYVLGPRSAKNDLIVWTSTNGGDSFDGGAQKPVYSAKTEPTDVFLAGETFLIGAYNPGLGFSTAEVGGLGGGAFSFANPGSGGVLNSSMDLEGGNPVIAYSNLDSPYPIFFYRYKGAGTITAETNWEGPTLVANGYEPSLAGGPSGLFMVSQDYTGGQNPEAINLRRFEGTSFGPPRTLGSEPANLFVGGAIDQSPGGNQLAVAWPGVRSGDGSYVMRLFASSDGGATFSERHVAFIGNAYAINDNAELTVGDDGAGWLVFTESSGLQMADLSPIAGAPGPGGAVVPPIYKGKTIVFSAKVGAFLITLRLPKRCLQSRQRFFAGVGKRKRRALAKKLGGKLKLTRVVFFYDGRRLRVKKRKPFRYLIDPGQMAPGSVHVVKARVTAILKKGKKRKKVKRTLKGKIRAC